MEESNCNHVYLPVYEYRLLVATAERIKAVQRLVDSGEYVSQKDIYSVLGIEVPKQSAEVAMGA